MRATLLIDFYCHRHLSRDSSPRFLPAINTDAAQLASNEAMRHLLRRCVVVILTPFQTFVGGFDLSSCLRTRTSNQVSGPFVPATCRPLFGQQVVQTKRRVTISSRLWRCKSKSRLESIQLGFVRVLLLLFSVNVLAPESLED